VIERVQSPGVVGDEAWLVADRLLRELTADLLPF